MRVTKTLGFDFNRFPWQTRIVIHELLGLAVQDRAHVEILKGFSSQMFCGDGLRQWCRKVLQCGGPVRTILAEHDDEGSFLRDLQVEFRDHLTVMAMYEYDPDLYHYCLVGDSAYRLEYPHSRWDGGLPIRSQSAPSDSASMTGGMVRGNRPNPPRPIRPALRSFLRIRQRRSRRPDPSPNRSRHADPNARSGARFNVDPLRCFPSRPSSRDSGTVIVARRATKTIHMVTLRVSHATRQGRPQLPTSPRRSLCLGDSGRGEVCGRLGRRGAGGRGAVLPVRRR